MTGITHRAARETDAAAIAVLHAASWRDAYRSILAPEFLAGPIEADRLSFWTRRLGDPPPSLSVRLALDADRRLVGFVAACLDHDPRWGSLIDNLHVLPEMRGRGIGEALLRSAARRLAARDARDGLHLWVFEVNEAGLRFYRRLGGEVVERDASPMPAARGMTVLRVHWPDLSAFSQGP